MAHGYSTAAADWICDQCKLCTDHCNCRKEFATPGAAEMMAKVDRDHGPDNDLEDYYSPDQKEQVYCTTEEREDFEQFTEIALTADVIEDQRDYDSLVRFLAEHYDLKEV
jgi:hypothetical protein